MREVLLPTPALLIECAKDGAANEKAAEDEEDDDRLIAGSGDQVGHGHEGAMGDYVAEGHEEDAPPVAEAHKQGRDTTDGVERDGSFGACEGSGGEFAGRDIGGQVCVGGGCSHGLFSVLEAVITGGISWSGSW